MPDQQHQRYGSWQRKLDHLQQQLDALRAQQGLVSGHQVQTQAQTNVPAAQDQAQVNPVNLESLYNATIKSRQYRAVDFAKLGNFSYTAQIKQTNINLALFAYGSIKHFLALTDGTLPSISPAELISRLQHCLNVLEIVCLGSNLSDFDSHGWKVGREYDQKIVRDIEQGFKH